jgi:GT2 family glycosyltransferase
LKGTGAEHEDKAGERSPCFISVVIVNYNGGPWLAQCLEALARQTFRAFEIIVVDNASTDGSAEEVARLYPAVKVVWADRNTGFAEGNNIGIRAARGEWVATLNSDTEVEPNYLEKLAELTREARTGMCAPLMLEMERRDVVDAAGIEVDVLGFAWNRGAGELYSRYGSGGPVFGACAGAALYRRAMLDQIGLFDRDYFAFYEDADLAWRARNAGWQAVFVPAARVFHVHGASFGKMSPQKQYWLDRNRWWTLVKNYPMPRLLVMLPLIALADAAALARALARDRSRPALMGRIDAWRSLGAALAKRRAIEHARPFPGG